jgi:hypothetical protein
MKNVKKIVFYSNDYNGIDLNFKSNLIQKLSICINNKLFKATMGFLFWTSLIIFSFEVMIGETVQFFFQLYFIHILVKSLSSLPGA